MKTFQHIVKDPLGIHARPAGMMVKEAKKYESVITITVGEESAEATELLRIMCMAIKARTEITIMVEGSDEAKASQEFQRFCEENV